MGSIFKRGDTYYISYKQAGKRIKKAVGKNKKIAELVLKKIEADNQTSELLQASKQVTTGPTLAEAAELWLAKRENTKRGVTTNEKGHINNHIVPHFGKRQISEIRPRDVADFLRALELKPTMTRDGTLAPRSVRNIYATLHKMYQDFVFWDWVASNPCDIPKEHKAPNKDHNPEFRDGAYFTDAEITVLLNSALIPASRRFFYGMAFYTGCRVGELMGLRWHKIYDGTPLNRLVISVSYDKETKTGKARNVPIHPQLMETLNWWKTEGYQAEFGVEPTYDGLIYPSPKTLNYRDANAVRRVLVRDLERHGMRKRRLHDTRRTFVTTGLAHKAPPHALERISHSPKGDVFSMYTSVDWPVLCQAINCFPNFFKEGQLGIGTSQ